METTEALLKECGLTFYESKAYITLLKLKVATAEQISEFANIPLPRVYDTLVQLQKKGFVLISKTRPKRFRPNKPKSALENLINSRKKDFEEDIKDMEKNIKKIANTLSKIPGEKLEERKIREIWSTEKRKNIVFILNEQKEMAKKEILIFSGDFSWIREAVKIIRQAIRKGVKIRAIVHEPQTKEWSKNIEFAKKIGINVRGGYKGLMRGHVIDNKTVSIAIKRRSDTERVEAGDGKPGSDLFHKYELVTSNNPILVKIIKENFEFWWKTLK